MSHKILIIDDDACNRDILKTRLEQSNYEVVEASNGEEGVRIAGDIRPDLIILDVMMPKVDGWLACRILKSKEETKGIPVVMLTARSQQIEEMRGWESGADEYVTKPAQPAICSRIKVMAGMDITERRLPQDGQAGMPHQDKVIDLRISTLPGKYGEKVVIRILDKSGLALGLERLGFDAPMQSVFESLIERPHGLILVTGPTGSGKTTTLYAVLNRLKSPLKNVITLEDPIEYELMAGSSNEMGITQVQVQPKIGLTFAAGLRSALRQDPDVIMVGEIRDKETAETAMAAAMTGHLVMSTLHANDAPGALGRLMDMGVERYLIASTVIGSLAQRLVRLLCSRCKEAYRPPARALEKLFPQRQGISRASFFRSKGCDHCQGAGYWGRRGIFELLTMTDELKQSMHAGESLQGIRNLMRSQGLKSLRESGMELVLQGLTTVEEVARVSTE